MAPKGVGRARSSACMVQAEGARGVQAGSGNAQYNYFQAAEPVEWPVTVGRAPLAADEFQDRLKLAEQVDQAREARPGGITLVLTGGGGTGKTQLAASLFREALPGLAVAVWVPATSRSAILSAYSLAWLRLHPGHEMSGDAEVGAIRFTAWLETTDCRWMVVLDDVQEPADLRGLWPIGPAGRVVVTTRRRDPALAGHRRTVVQVDVFTSGEAGAFLSRKLSTSSVPAVLGGADRLAEDLGRLPLAMAQAGSVILDEGITCNEYRSWFADRSRRLADLFTTDPGDEYEHTVATTWSLAADRANIMPPPVSIHGWV